MLSNPDPCNLHAKKKKCEQHLRYIIICIRAVLYLVDRCPETVHTVKTCHCVALEVCLEFLCNVPSVKCEPRDPIFNAFAYFYTSLQ